MTNPSGGGGGSARQGKLALDPSSNSTGRVAGVVDRIAFHSEETGFSVLRLKGAEGRDLTTVVGRTAQVSPGEWVEAEGHFRTDPRHGPQLQADEIRVSAPTTRAGIEHFLGSGIVPGVGPGLAKRLVEHFGSAVLDVIGEEPERLREIPGVGQVRSGRIARAWQDQRKVREVMLFLHSHGIGAQRAVRIQKMYGEQTLETLRRDPYRLVRDVRGVGFATADALARSLGFEPEAESRVRAGIRQILRDALAQGHCGRPHALVIESAAKLLGISQDRVTLSSRDLVDEEELEEDTVEGETALFLPELHRAETRAAHKLVALAKGEVPWSQVDLARALARVEEKLTIEFAEDQRHAISRALESKLLVLTGGPGVGKTTLVRAILSIVANSRIEIQLAAPTGRAAKRLAEATGRSAQTIHRLLEANARSGGFKRGAHNPLDCEFLVVDESSMIDVRLLDALVSALRPSCAVLFIGDVDQLPSVGAGQVLRDMIESQVLPVVKLDRIFRQAAESQIIQSAHAVNAGTMPVLETRDGGDFYFIETRDSEDALARLLKVVGERIEARFGLDPSRDVQILTPMHRGRVGAQNLNAELQQLLNPAREREPTAGPFRPGDKVMQVVNNYDKDVYNGDVGWVERIDPEEKNLDACFEDRSVRYTFAELDELTLAYAITIHKSQGSEYPAVVIPIVTDHYVMLRRNLIYTGMTRGRQLVVLLGQRRALELAIRNSGDLERTTRLRAQLARASSKSGEAG